MNDDLYERISGRITLLDNRLKTAQIQIEEDELILSFLDNDEKVIKSKIINRIDDLNIFIQNCTSRIDELNNLKE